MVRSSPSSEPDGGRRSLQPLPIRLAHWLNVVFAGIMISCGQFGGDPTLGKVYILQSIAAVVVGGTALTGGTGGVVNTVIGALTLGVMENGMNVVAVDAYFQQSILGLVIIVSVALTFDRMKVGMIK